jgi:3alpha(or 20beta)-hydroxysteroid dehydrogenase
VPSGLASGLADTRFVVTGAGGGIGSAVVQRLTELGSGGFGVDLAFSAPPPPGCTHVTADVSSADQWQEVSAMLGAEGLDILVNAAGVELTSSLRDTSPDQFERVMRINVLGTFLSIRSLESALVSASGSVVNIGSSLGLTGAAQSSAYAASKGAVASLSRALAAELGPSGVRVNCVCPGPIETHLFWRNIDAKVRSGQFLDSATAAQAHAEKTMLRRNGRALEVADVVVHLASPASSYITGAVIPVDGGKTAAA